MDKRFRSFLNEKDADKDAIHWEWEHERKLLDFDIALLTTKYLAEIATKLFLAMPEYSNSDMWIRHPIEGNRMVFSNKAISELRTQIRKERKENIELAAPIIAVITGLIGALTGLVAVLK